VRRFLSAWKTGTEPWNPGACFYDILWYLMISYVILIHYNSHWKQDRHQILDFAIQDPHGAGPSNSTCHRFSWWPCSHASLTAATDTTWGAHPMRSHPTEPKQNYVPGNHFNSFKFSFQSLQFLLSNMHLWAPIEETLVTPCPQPWQTCAQVLHGAIINRMATRPRPWSSGQLPDKAVIFFCFFLHDMTT
jgi:hypothetical protein